MTLSTTSRVDMHCHSTASVWSKLGVQRALGLPECATPPQDVLELAVRRGMDFVTITDHDTIVGAQEIADDPRVFLSEELTVAFKGEAQAVHVLCYGITPDDHEWLQAHNDDVEACAAYLHDSEITTALAHPFFAVAAPLEPRHRRRLAQLFPVWETRNGSRAPELNAPAAIYIETHGGTGIGGSDDHAGVDIGRTFTESAGCATPQEFLAQIRSGQAVAGGEQGSAAKWAHAAMGLATRALGAARPGTAAPSPRAVMSMVERIVREGDARGGAIGADLCPDDARAMMAAWLSAVELDLEDGDLLALLQADDFSHAALFRRARRCHERKLARAVDGVLAATNGPGGDLLGAATGLFEACVGAIPYAPAAAFLGQEKAKLARRDPATDLRRVALVADGVGAMHGVTHTLDEIRERGVPGFEVEVVGTDPNVDRRLSAVAEVEVPYYAGLTVGVPSLPAIVEVLADGRYDLVQVCSPGPAGVAAMMIARVMDLPVLGGYHTELAAYVGMRSMDPMLEAGAKMAIAAFYGQCATVLSPSEASDGVLATMGIEGERVQRWDRGVDLARFRPGLRTAPEPLEGDAINVLYAGRQTKEKGADLLADAFEAAHARDPRLHLRLAGGGPEEEVLRERLGDRATFLGWLEGDDLARAYADADLFLFASRTDTFGQVLLEAQASGLPVVAVAEGGPCSLVEDGVTGLLCAPEATALADAVVELAGSPLRRATLARAALDAVAERTWESALGRLAGAYGRTLATASAADLAAAAGAEGEARRVAA